MGEETLFDKIRNLIGSVSWRIFLWSVKMTANQYRKAIYEQESDREALK